MNNTEINGSGLMFGQNRKYSFDCSLNTLGNITVPVVRLMVNSVT